MKKPRPRAIKERAAKTAAVTAPASALAAEAPAEKKRRVGPVQFFKEVRAETRKITWPTRNETVITSLIVFVMVLIASVFFMIVDFVLHGGVNLILKFANSGSLS